MIQAADPALSAMTQTIVERFAPERVLLFGSRARGEARSDSDYDLMIVVDDPEDDRRKAIRDAIGDQPRNVDIVVVTPERFESRRDDVGTLCYIVDREGRVLYDRNPARWARRVCERPNGLPLSLDEWIDRGLSSYRAMEREFAGPARDADVVSYLAQQGAEKLLKAALVASHVPPPRTHALHEVLRRGPPELRDNPRVVAACAVLDGLWEKMRYPEHPIPTDEEATASVEAARIIRAAVAHFGSPDGWGRRIL